MLEVGIKIHKNEGLVRVLHAKFNVWKIWF
jgi:hypothetical protein